MSADQYNIDLATRQIQINDWSYNNKMDTLFVFQILFMSILFVSILMGFKSIGLIGGAFVWYTLIILIILVVIIIVNRSMYTNNRRDDRMWNKRRFDEDNTKESPLGRGDSSYQSYLDSVRSTYGKGSSSCSCDT
jgi:amino acid transporter